jgi:pimeloyl-ACP methyl ester carboxylesterase
VLSQHEGTYFGTPASLSEAPEHEGRLVPTLREAAQTRDPVEILSRAAQVFFLARNPPPGVGGLITEDAARALADLSVSGRAAFERFRTLLPSEADVFPRALQLAQVSPAGVPASPENVTPCVRDALDRAYRVAAALRGAETDRAALGWIAVSGEDDPPHRPVNVPVAPYPQYDITVPCRGISVNTRYMIASPGPQPPRAAATARSLPVDPVPSIPAHHEIILFVHGHSSRLEECLDLVPHLHQIGLERGSHYSVVAMDLPCCGYASMFDHAQVADSEASQYPSSYPILDFIEEFIANFVNELDHGLDIKNRIAAVIGGSLGGNMGLRLGEHGTLYPWLKNIVSWSPASVWRALVNDAVKGMAPNHCRGQMKEEENTESRKDYFRDEFDKPTVQIASVIIVPPQPAMWYRDGWEPCKSLYIDRARLERQEIYNQWFRRWHWRVALEQLIFSHRDPELPGSRPRCESITANVLLLAGQKDNYNFTNIYDSTGEMAVRMGAVPGHALLLLDTGHSIHNERPGALGRLVVNFLRRPVDFRSVREFLLEYEYDPSGGIRRHLPSGVSSVWAFMMAVSFARHRG